MDLVDDSFSLLESWSEFVQVQILGQVFVKPSCFFQKTTNRTSNFANL